MTQREPSTSHGSQVTIIDNLNHIPALVNYRTESKESTYVAENSKRKG